MSEMHTAVRGRHIPVAAPDLTTLEEKLVVEAVRSTWISSSGPFIDAFEKQFAELCQSRYCVTVCNGTIALHLALLALGVGPGDEVLVPSLTYVATANAVRYVGAEPVFVDSDPHSWCIDPKLIEASITRRTKGIIPVHLYGHPADMDEINAIASVYGLWVIEDSAEAHLAKYKGRTVGSLAQMATFSFYGNKIFTCGEGGAIVLNDDHTQLRLRILRGQGMHPQRRYYFPTVGYNFRLTNVACAILCAQLQRREEILAKRSRVFAAYRDLLAGTPGVGFQPVAPWAVPAPWLFSITIDAKAFGCSRDQLADLLAQEGIETRPFFSPLHKMPPFRSESRQRSEDLPVTDAVAAAGLNLPTFAALTDDDLDHIVSTIKRLRK